jgi:ferric-dicitrate binding protein FerR (iron transport regulator)
MPLPDRTILLFQRYIGQAASDDETDEMLQILSQAEGNGKLDEVMAELWQTLEVKEAVLGDWEKERMLKLILNKEKSVIRTISWKKMIAAAAIILIMGYGLWVMSGRKAARQQGNEIAKTHDVPAPNNSRAVITLADGSKVYLDSVNNGTIAQQNNVQVMKTADGKILYNANGQQLAANNPVYNTLTNPRGSKVIDMQLSDGSHVWLNAGSSVKYPVAFVGNERKVEITGEAYFEIAHNASKPFIVSKGETSVTVLGTHFNVNAYDDEDALRVTLLEGSVKVSAANKVVTIKPGEQAQVNGGNAIGLVVNRGVDVDQVMAWKNGKFSFNKDDIRTVMRQLARWYDLEVVYEGEVTNAKFWGDIQRDLPLSETLSFLKESKVKFEIQGKKVTVKK